MRVRRAHKSDLPKINQLASKYGWEAIPEEFINRRDIALVAVDDKKEVQGFVWVGLTAQNTVGFIDCFVVNPELSSKGVGKDILLKMTHVADKLGVQYLAATITRDQHHDKSYTTASRVGLQAVGEAATRMLGQVKQMKDLIGE